MKRSGFTLIELSIVLVIVALIIGGIVVGQELIRVAKLRRIVTEYERLNTTYLAFKNKYNGLPGDIPNAVQFWGASAGDSSDNYTLTCKGSISATGTCNGNSDGLIGGHIDTTGAPCNNSAWWWAVNCNYEQFAQAHQLSLAGMIEGSYATGWRGIPLGPYWVRGPGGNLPYSSNFQKDGFHVQYSCTATADVTLYPGLCGNAFFYGEQSPSIYQDYRDFPLYPALSGAEAKGIDSKIDEGTPSHGKVMTITLGQYSTMPYTPDCATSWDPTLADYNVSNNDKRCSLIIKAQGF